MSLLDKLPDSISIKFTKLDQKEMELYALIKKAYKNIALTRYAAEVNLEKQHEIIKEASSLLENYNGRFQPYFDKSIGTLKNMERMLIRG